MNTVKFDIDDNFGTESLSSKEMELIEGGGSGWLLTILLIGKLIADIICDLSDNGSLDGSRDLFFHYH